MSEFLVLAVTFASFAVSSLSLFVTIAAYRRLDAEAHETFAVIGADEGNHEARLERLETKAGLTVIPSPSALEEMLNDADEDSDLEIFADEFAEGQEDAELRASHEAMDNEGAPSVNN